MTMGGVKISFFSAPLIFILTLSQGVCSGLNIFGLGHSAFPHLSFCLLLKNWYCLKMYNLPRLLFVAEAERNA